MKGSKTAAVLGGRRRNNSRQRNNTSVFSSTIAILLLQVIRFCSGQQNSRAATIDGIRRGAKKSSAASAATALHVDEARSRIAEDDRELLDLRLLWGGAGLAFDADNNLIHPQMIAKKINKLDPETGKVLDSFSDSVHFVNDVVIAPDGTIYWTVLLSGTIYKRPPGGPTEEVYPPFSYPSADGIALSDNGDRLFFAQCRFPGDNYIYQRNMTTGETVKIGEPRFFCIASSLAFRNEALYATNFLSGEFFKVDISNGDPENPVISDVTTVLQTPAKVAFDSNGDMYAVDFVHGTVYKVDFQNNNNTDINNNAELIATLPGGLEGLAFDANDRLYVTSFFHGSIWEVVQDQNNQTDFRVVRDKFTK